MKRGGGTGGEGRGGRERRVKRGGGTGEEGKGGEDGRGG